MISHRGLGRLDSANPLVDALVTHMDALPVSAFRADGDEGSYLSAVLRVPVGSRPWTYCLNLGAMVGGVTMVFPLPAAAGEGWAVIYTRDEHNPDEGEHPWKGLWGTGPRLDRAFEWAQQCRAASSLSMLALGLTAEILRHEDEFMTLRDSLNRRPHIWALRHVLDRLTVSERDAVRSLMALRHGPAASAHLSTLLTCATALIDNLPHQSQATPVLRHAAARAGAGNLSDLDLEDLDVGEDLMRTPFGLWRATALSLVTDALRARQDQNTVQIKGASHGQLFSPAVI